ncbi:MAG: YceI family protein [Thermomicrobiales bacterium]
MRRFRTDRRLQVVAVLILIPFLFVAGLGIYLANLARALPWQEEPTPIAADITPFANLPTPTSIAASPRATTPRVAPTGSPAESPAPAGGATYAVVSAESQARYVVQETVGRLSLPTEAVGRTNAVRGELALDAEGRPLPGSEIEVDLRTLQSGEGQRDNFIQTVTLKDAPLATFVITGVEAWPGPMADGQEQAFLLVGEMTINAVTRPVVFEATAARTGDTIIGSATTTFAWEDFNLTPPNIAAQMISIEETARIELDVTARVN